MFLYEKLSNRDLENYKKYLEDPSVHPASRIHFWSSWLVMSAWCLRFQLVNARKKAHIPIWKLAKKAGLKIKDIRYFEDMNNTVDEKKLRDMDFIMKYAKGVGITEITINIKE